MATPGSETGRNVTEPSIAEVAVAACVARSAPCSQTVCGEQGGDPASVEFCFKNNLTYVSCSPFRVPIARLAAAQAAIKAKS